MSGNKHGHSRSSGGSNHGHRSGGGLGSPHHSKHQHHHSGNGASFTMGLFLGALASDTHSHCHQASVFHEPVYDFALRRRLDIQAVENQRLAKEYDRLRQEAEQKQRQEEAARKQLLDSHQSLLPLTDVFYGIPSCLDVTKLGGLKPLSASMPVPVIPGTDQTLAYLALYFRNIDLFSEAINNKGYRLNSPKHAPYNPIVFIATMTDGAEYLERVKAKVTKAEVDVLVEEIYYQVFPLGQISQSQMDLLIWLWNNKRTILSSDKFDYFAKVGYKVYPNFSCAVFSSSSGNFVAIDAVIRRDILSSIKPDHLTLLAWYYTNNVFQAKKLCDDLHFFQSSTLENDLLIVLHAAVEKNYSFGELDPACLNWLVTNYDTCTQSILNYLIRTQPKMVNDLLPQLDTANQMKLIRIAPGIVCRSNYERAFENSTKEELDEGTYQLISDKTTGDTREKMLLAFVAAQFKKADTVESIINSAKTREAEWKLRGSCVSPRAIEAMLKLAKTEILTRLKDERAISSPAVADFMAKNRTTHHFFCMPFQLTIFSTPSTKAYNLYGKRDKFEAAVAKEVERGEAEFRAVMGA